MFLVMVNWTQIYIGNEGRDSFEYTLGSYKKIEGCVSDLKRLRDVKLQNKYITHGDFLVRMVNEVRDISREDLEFMQINLIEDLLEQKGQGGSYERD